MTRPGAVGDSSVCRTILGEIRDRAPISTSQLVERLDVPRSRVRTELARLAALELIEPAGTGESTGGRRSSLVRIHRDVRYVVVHLGTVSTRVGVIDGSLLPVETTRIESGLLTGPDEALAEALADVRRIRAGGDARSRVRLLGAALVLSGDLDGTPDGSAFVRTPGGAWETDAWLEALSAAVEAPVSLVSAAHAEALGDAGAERGAETIFVRLGATVGAVSVVDGSIRADGPFGGSIGHLRVEPFGPACSCGRSGCLDVVAGGAAIMRHATTAVTEGRSELLRRLTSAEQREPRLVDVLAAARAGDASLARVTGDVGRQVGSTVAALVAFASPDRLVIGGPFSGLGDQLLIEVRGELQRVAPPRSTRDLEIELARNGAAGCLIGGARAASELVDLSAAVGEEIS